MKRRSVPKSTALALAVSLWMAGGVALAQDTVIERDLFIGDAYGGKAERGSDAVGNTLTAKFAIIAGDVYGGYAAGGSARGNRVTLFDTTAEENVYGGYAINGDAVSNTVTAMFRSLLQGDVYGGYAVKGNATGNTVTLMNASTLGKYGIVNVYGGYTTNGNATGNTVTLEGSQADKVYGGFTANGDATHNTVRLINSTVHSVYGGNTGNTGNTLNLLGANIVRDTVDNFKIINIRSAIWGRPALTALAGVIKNTPAINADGIIFTEVPRVREAVRTVLIHKLEDGYAGHIKEETHFQFGTTLQGTGKTKIDATSGNLVFEVNKKPDGTPDVEIQEQTHNVLMGAGAGMATLSAGNDFIGAATEGLSQAANVGADGISSFATMGGGSMRQETGSHIDVKSWNAILALGRKNKKERGTFEYGAFFEYGYCNYATHNDGLRGDGSTRYTGGGLLAKWTTKRGVYVEGSLRAGSVHGEPRSALYDADGRPFSCDVDAPYWGLHLGVGKEFALKNGDSVDVYGRFFLNRRNSTSFDMGGHYDLDALTSKVIRVGARYTLKRGGKWNYYGGLAYEYELDGKARGTADGFAIRGTDTSGGSLRAEIGATIEPDVKSPWKLDLNLAGFAGKKRGLTGGVSVAWMF